MTTVENFCLTAQRAVGHESARGAIEVKVILTRTVLFFWTTKKEKSQGPGSQVAMSAQVLDQTALRIATVRVTIKGWRKV